MKKTIAIILFCTALLALPVMAHAQEAQPGAACSPNGRIVETGGPEQMPRRVMICNGSTWRPFLEQATDGTSLFQINNDTGSCTAAKEGRLRFNDSTNLWSYCRSGSWTNFTTLPTCDVGQGYVMTGSGWGCCPEGIDSWTVNTSPDDHFWSDVTYGNGLFVAVGQDYSGSTHVMTSPDGATWTLRTTPDADTGWPWMGVTYGNNIFVAVSKDDYVMTSPDGINWTARTGSTFDFWRSVAYGAGLFVAVGYGGYDEVMTSPDGITWTTRTAEEGEWTDVVYAGGQFVAVAEGGTNRVMTSPDGITWTARTPASAEAWQSVAYGNGTYVAVAQSGASDLAMTSPDGITWTGRAIPENGWTSVTLGDGMFVAVASAIDEQVATSPDGITWTQRSTPSDYDDLRAIATDGNGTYAVVGTENPGSTLSANLVACP